ncbi:MAG: Fic family protein [Bdellovibrionia bacterium]
MSQYLWQQKTWPQLDWRSDQLLEPLGQARKAQGKVIAQAEYIGLETQARLVVEEAFTTSAIEGEKLDRNTIRSSVARRLGLPTAGLPAEERRVEGLVEMLLDATTSYKEPLTTRRLHGWHAALFPTGYSGMDKIQVGDWRKGSEPMRVVSGRPGREKVHYEAPPSAQISDEMKQFLSWWKAPSPNLDGLIRAGVAHLWFVTIHPFDDGNGRITRAITDMAIAQDEAIGRRLYSLSTQIIQERNVYYEILEKTQKQSCDITEWLKWFLQMYTRAVNRSQDMIQKALRVGQFWQKRSNAELNERQLKVIKRLVETEPVGFEGGLTNRKYVSMTKTSRETAKRDLSDLEAKGLIKRNPGKGRSVSYSLVIKESSS